MTSIIHIRNRRGGRVAECAGLENRCTARYRGFKSHPLRLDSKALNEPQKDAISCSGNGLRLVVSDEPEDVEHAVAFNRSQPESAVRAKKCDKNEPTELGRSVPTLDEVRKAVDGCEELPEHIRAAVQALLLTVPVR
jgi:hypothetical protein